MDIDEIKLKLENIILEGKRNIKISGRNKMFKEYLQTTKLPMQYGLSRTNIHALLEKVQSAKTMEQLEALSKHVEEYRIHTSNFYNINNSYAHNFFQTQYYLYFFYARKRNIPKVMLGRAILRIDGIGNAEIKNIDDGSEDYEGRFELINEHVMFLDFKAAESKSRLHLKIETTTTPRPYSIGLSLGYENKEIIGGTLILELRPNDENLIAGKFTHLDDEFYDIDECIRRYLSLKRHNQIKAPSDIHSSDALCNFFQGYMRNKKTNFFDAHNPIMFISTPTDSIAGDDHISKKTVILKLIDKLKEEFTQYGVISGRNFKMDVRYPGEDNLKDKSPLEILEIKKRQIKDFELIERTKFFILIFEKEVVSKALIELGMAMNNAECVWIFIKSGIKFPDLKELESHPRFNSFKIFYFSDDLLDDRTQSDLFLQIFHNVILHYPHIKPQNREIY